jgi:hypothetical protein
MIQTTTNTILDQFQQSSDQLDHICCDDDFDRSLCGCDITDFPWAGDEEEVNCVVCNYLDAVLP